MSVNLTDAAELRRVGLDALHRALGPVGMLRFLMQFERGHGNYSEDRHEWLDHETVDSIMEGIRQRRAVNEESQTP